MVPPSNPSPASGVPAGYEHSELEQELIDAMAAAGVADPGIAEHGFRTADVSGLWGGHRAWAHAYLTPGAETPGQVVDDVTVDGVAAKVIRTESFGDVLTFSCGDVGYQVTVLGADWQVETGSVERATTFAAELIPYLECSL